MNDIQFVQFLFEVRVQAHHLHHITESYAEHKALGKFYEHWDDLLDTFIETYQGKYGRVKGMGRIVFDNTNAKIIIEDAKKKLLSPPITEQDIDMQNIIADMIALCNHTLYLLTLK